MDPFAFPPLTALLDGAYGALAGLVALLAPVAGASAAAVAVMLVTLLVRALLIPVGVSQARAEQVRARLAPRLRELQRRHRRDPERLQKEMLALYRSENTSPLAGMLPVLAQAPVVGLLYTLFIRIDIGSHPNELLAHDLFGVPLGTSLVGAVAGGAAGPAVLLVFGGLLAVILLTSDLTRRLLRPAPVEADDSPLNSAGAQRLVGVLHYATAVVAIFVPLAAALYLTVTVVWTLGQRLILRRRYPLPQTAQA